ncbi:response regulator [Lignipirellula cremea]|uniref:Oxygen regulatory protein NreC n=1 Tax=Lignipirellula cremea TaxID=2528010 RepID=A0A518E4H8_9BACT|nr:response regulator transcription factor [Lignipirellula cremea]QDU98973.1 Oxygen regulatory protein NreC [Lignipirellula cremea]
MSAPRTQLAGELARIMIVDDHPTVREGLAGRVVSQPDMVVCGEAIDVREALEKVSECRPDLMIVDISLKNSDGLELIKAVRARHKKVRLLVHSMYDESVYAERSLKAGASGYVNKEADPGVVIEAMHEVLAGGIYLSPAMKSEILGRAVSHIPANVDPVASLTDRQLEIFRLIAEGKTTSQIAARLQISVHTVETHRDNIKRRLNVSSMTELTRMSVMWDSENR